MKTKLLDCTLRDGGYYNNWDFDPVLVSKYLDAMSEISVDWIEIGFRTIDNSKFRGPYAFSTDSFLSSLSIPYNLRGKIGVMINADEYLRFGNSAIKEHFLAKENSLISLVRIAAHYEDFFQLKPFIKELKNLGYIVGVNLMQIASFSEEEISKAAKFISTTEADVFYFADSFGSLQPHEVTNLIANIRKSWKGEIGCHMHDNLSFALVNTILSYESGATWLDSTVHGMGRGPGNCRTELLINTNIFKVPLFNQIQLTSLIEDGFARLNSVYKWGTNQFYFFSGVNAIHPTYVQKMLSDEGYNHDSIMRALNYLVGKNSSSFSEELIECNKLRDIFTLNELEEVKYSIPILIAPGPSVEKYEPEIERLKQGEKNYVFIGLNYPRLLNKNLIDFRVCGDEIKFISQMDYHLQDEVITLIGSDSLLDFDLSVTKFCTIRQKTDKTGFGLNQLDLRVPKKNTFSLALLFSSFFESNEILLIGFDGYDDDTKNMEQNQLIRDYEMSQNSKQLVSLTPTKYHINIRSIYNE